MSSSWTEARGRQEGIPCGENFYPEHLNPSRTPSCFLREKIPHPDPERVRIPLGTQDPGGRGQGHNDSLGGYRRVPVGEAQAVRWKSGALGAHR